MSTPEGSGSQRKNAYQDPLTDNERAQVERYLSDPFSFPPELWAWIKGKMESDPPSLSVEAIGGFDAMVLRAAPVYPGINLAVDVSAASTDLPSPGRTPFNFWEINPAGGSLRSIKTDNVSQGANLLLYNDHASSVTIKNNDVTGAGNPLLLLGLADIVLASQETMQLIWDGSFWREVNMLGADAAVAIGTAFPTTGLVDGQEFIIRLDSFGRRMWRFIYDAGESGSYKWKFIGGPAIAESDASITAPLSGDYNAIGHSAYGNGGTTTPASHTLNLRKNNGGATVKSVVSDAVDSTSTGTGARQRINITIESEITGQTGGQAIDLTGGETYSLMIAPIRCI